MMYYSNDYLAHYGVIGMKWGQHLMARSQTKSARKAKIAKGKSMTSKADQRISKAFTAGATVSAGVAGFGTGVKLANRAIDAGIREGARINMQVFGNSASAAMLNSIKAAEVASMQPYLAGALALGAVTAAGAYAISKHSSNKRYAKLADSASK